MPPGDDVGDIAEFYDMEPQREHDRLLTQQLEWELTWRFLGRHLPPDGSVLDLGAGTGRYSAELARRGYSVTASDLSAELIGMAQAHVATVAPVESVRFLCADARDVEQLRGESFDAILVMGPLYHLVELEDRQLVISNAQGLLRPGGVIFSAFLSRLGVLGDLLRRVPEWIDDQPHVRSFIERGKRPDDAAPGGFRGYFARPEEVVELHEAAGFETIVLAGVEPAISAHDESFNELGGSRREQWLDLLHEVAAEPTTLGASRHLLYVGRSGVAR